MATENIDQDLIDNEIRTRKCRHRTIIQFFNKRNGF